MSTSSSTASFRGNTLLALFREVAHYIKIMYVWWTIMNVNSPFKGARLKQQYATPLTNVVNNESYLFLHKFYNWLDTWDCLQSTGKLSKETFTAIKHTTLVIIEVTNYCINELK